MSKRYLVTRTPHYIGQRMVNPDRGAESIVTLPEGVKPGRWLVPLDDAPAVTPVPAAPIQAVERFKARHNGGGRWLVENIDDGSRASVVFDKDEGDAKAKAEAEAARLNAGGEIHLGVMDGDLSSAQEDSPAGIQTGDLPDA